MGLDAVWLLIEVEETFGVTIDDQTATGIVTVGELYEMLRERCPVSAVPPVCLTQVAFYRLRAAWCQVLGVPRAAIRPNHTLADALPAARRRELWQRTAHITGLRMPKLRRPEWLSTLLSTLGLGGILLGTAGFVIGSPAFGLVGLWTAMLSLAAFAASTPWAVQVALPLLPVSAAVNHRQTLGDLVRQVASENRVRFMAQQTAWHDRDLWDTLVQLIAEQLGVPAEKITPASRFVDDLGMD